MLIKKKQREETTNIGNQLEDITTDLATIKKKKEYCKKLYAHRKKIDTFFENNELAVNKMKNIGIVLKPLKKLNL